MKDELEQGAMPTEIETDNLDNMSGANQEDSQGTSAELGSESKPEDESFDWTKDKRHGKIWKNENDLYKSYKNLEKMQSPLKQQADNIKSLAEKYGVSVDKIEDVLKEHKEYSNPDGNFQQWVKYLSEWLNDPDYKDKVIGQFRDLERDKYKKKYGDNLNDEQIADRRKLEDLENWKKDFETKEKSKQEQIELGKAIEDKMVVIGEYAKANDIDFGEEDQLALLKYCKEREMYDPKYLPEIFKALVAETKMKESRLRAEASATKNVARGRSAGVVTGGSSQKQPDDSWSSALQKLGKSFTI